MLEDMPDVKFYAINLPQTLRVQFKHSSDEKEGSD